MTKCSEIHCQETAPWKGGSVAKFKEENPGWRWIARNDGSGAILCPDHGEEAMRLGARLYELLGKYGVLPMLRPKDGLDHG